MSCSHYRTNKQAGFTLIELMVVVVIAAILLAIAVPSFQNLIMRSNVDSLQSRLSSAVSTARTEAASRNTVMTICGSTDQAACTTATTANGIELAWSEGWIIFEDRDGSGAFNGADVLVDVFANDSEYTVTVIDAAGSAVSALSFNSQGFLANNGRPTLFLVCEPDDDDNFARGLFVNVSGLVMKTRDGDDSGGIHDDPFTTGNNLDCTP